MPCCFSTARVLPPCRRLASPCLAPTPHNTSLTAPLPSSPHLNSQHLSSHHTSPPHPTCPCAHPLQARTPRPLWWQSTSPLAGRLWVASGGWCLWVAPGGWLLWVASGGWRLWVAPGGWRLWVASGGWRLWVASGGWRLWVASGGQCHLLADGRGAAGALCRKQHACVPSVAPPCLVPTPNPPPAQCVPAAIFYASAACAVACWVHPATLN